ncbi:MAG: hypothetical protein ACIAXF_11150 [Phycisphaerales bacterium JB063]
MRHDAASRETDNTEPDTDTPRPRNTDNTRREPAPGPIAQAPPPTAPHAKSLMARMQRLADRTIANAQCPITADEEKPPPSRNAQTATCQQSHQASQNAANTSRLRDQSFAIQLAEILKDPGSLTYYEHLAHRLRLGELLKDRPARDRRDLTLAKARAYAARRAPAGPILNPAACFVNWVKKQG